MSTLKLCVMAPDVPFPPNRGGRADVWRRLLAFKRLGVSVQLLSFFDDTPAGRPSSAHLAEMTNQVNAAHLFPIEHNKERTVRRLLNVADVPWHVACRTLPDSQLQQLLANIERQGKPDFVWLEGPWCGQLARQVSAHFGAGLLYRSHNIEHQYMPRQARSAQRLRDRLAWTVASIGLARYERGLMDAADHVFDISHDDLAFWQAQGLNNASWLPPLPEVAVRTHEHDATMADPAISTEVLFLGNLRTPNNVSGATWLLDEVYPKVAALRPGTRFTIAGSNPEPAVKAACERQAVRLLPNVPDAIALYRASRVLVNPVRTGSGTHMKMIEMLMTDARIVSSTQGTRGLPEGIEDMVAVADEAEPFARAIVDALDAPAPDLAARRAYCRPFSVAGVRDALRLALPAQSFPELG